MSCPSANDVTMATRLPTWTGARGIALVRHRMSDDLGSRSAGLKPFSTIAASVQSYIPPLEYVDKIGHTRLTIDARPIRAPCSQTDDGPSESTNTQRQRLRHKQ